jgi:ribulose-5-phosphate 4-epimerase/fuculose-1-phosphate aldolase
MPKQKTPCPRCGMMLWAGQMPQHRPTCDALPLPGDLLQMLKASGLSVHAFAQSLGYESSVVIRKRLLLVDGMTGDGLKEITRQAKEAAQTASMITCGRCGRQISAGHTAVHNYACQAHPPGVELVAEWRKSGLRVAPFCGVTGYEANHVTAVLEAHGVTKAERDAAKTAHSLERVETCVRCDIRLDRAPGCYGLVCDYCLREVKRKYSKPLPTAYMMVGMRG